MISEPKYILTKESKKIKQEFSDLISDPVIKPIEEIEQR